MAEFLDSGSPEFVYAPNGLLVDRSALGPMDTVKPAAGSVPPPAAAPAPMAPAAPTGAPGAPPTAASLIAKRDAVLGPMVTTGSSTTTQRTPGISGAVLDPIMAGNTARTDAMANTVRQAGNDAAARKEDMADRDIYLSQGRQATADAVREDAAQRAEIARKNELALSLQKDAEIDPDRFVKNMSTGQQIATTVLAALNGGFKGMVGQSGNDVMDILSKRIDSDIASQKEQVASGRVRRGNLVAYFQNQGLREEAAVKAAEATSWAMVDRMVAAEREKIGAGQDRTTADVMAEQLKMKTAERNDELKLTLGQDRTTTSTTTQRARQQPAEMDPLKAMKLAEGMLRLDAAKLDQMDAQSVSKAVGRDLSPAAVKALKEKVASVGPGVNETDGAVQFTAQYVEALGGKMDKTTGHITWPEDLAGAGPLDSRPSLKAGPFAPVAKMGIETGAVHTDNQKAKDAQDALREFITKNLTGASATPDQQKTFSNMVGADLDNEARVRANTENWANTLFALRGGQMARLGPEGQKLLELNRGNAQTGAGAGELVPR